jgi:hypothetical protein
MTFYAGNPANEAFPIRTGQETSFVCVRDGVEVS